MDPFLTALRSMYHLQPRQEEMEIPQPEAPEPEVPPPAPTPDPTLVSRVGDVVSSGLSVLGNVLDLPGSMVRDTLTAKNPFDQLLTPFSDTGNRTSGRELLRDWGMAGKEDTWGNFGGGLAVEILADPLTYMTFGASALTKGGKALSKIDKLKDAKKIATELTGKKTGKAAARQELTPRSVMDYRARQFAKKAVDDDATKNFDDLYKSAYDELLGKFRKAGGSDDMLDTSIGGEVGFGLPFSDPKWVWGARQHGADHLGDGLGKIAPTPKTTPPPRPESVTSPPVKSTASATSQPATVATQAPAPATPRSPSFDLGRSRGRSFAKEYAAEKLANDSALDTDRLQSVYDALDDDAKQGFVDELKTHKLLPKTLKFEKIADTKSLGKQIDMGMSSLEQADIDSIIKADDLPEPKIDPPSQTPPTQGTALSTAETNVTPNAVSTKTQATSPGRTAAQSFAKGLASKKLKDANAFVDDKEIQKIGKSLDADGKKDFIDELRSLGLLTTQKAQKPKDIAAAVNAASKAIKDDEWGRLSKLSDTMSPEKKAKAPAPPPKESDPLVRSATELTKGSADKDLIATKIHQKLTTGTKPAKLNLKDKITSTVKAAKESLGEMDVPSATAAARDTLFGGIANSLPGRIFGSLFIPERRGQVQDFAIDTAERTYENINDAVSGARFDAYPVVTKIYKSGLFDEDQIMDTLKIDDRAKAVEIANKRHDTFLDQLESTTDDELQELINQNRKAGDNTYADALEAGKQVRSLLSQTLDEMQRAGVPVENLREEYIKAFIPRRAHAPGKQTARYNPARGQLVENTNQSMLGRKLDDLPGRTRVLNEISMDPNISALKSRLMVKGKEVTPEELDAARNLLKTRYKNELVDTAKLNSQISGVKQSEAELDNAKSTLDGLLKSGAPKSEIETAQKTVDDIASEYAQKRAELQDLVETTNIRIETVLQWAIDLDPYYANYKLPFFGRNLINPVMDYLENMFRVQGNIQFVRNLVRNTALPIRTYAQRSGFDLKEIARGMPETQFGKGERLGDVLEKNKVARLRFLEKVIQDDIPELVKPAMEEAELLATAVRAGVSAPVPDDLAKAVDMLQSVQKSVEILEEAKAKGKTPKGLLLTPQRLRQIQDTVDAAKERYYKEVLNLVEIPSNMSDSISKYLTTGRVSDEVRPLIEGFDRGLNTWRMGQTALFPAFHARNLFSGQADNLMAGHYNPLTMAQSVRDAHNLYTGKNVEGLAEQLGVATDEEATDLLRRYAFAHGLIGGKRGLSTELIGDQMEVYAQQVPGLSSPNVLAGEFTPAPHGTTWWQALNPFNSRNVINPIETAQDVIRGYKTKQQLDKITGSNQDQFIGTRIGQDIAGQFEGYNRLAPFVSLIRKGYAPDVAAQIVKDTQVDYTKLSQFERDWMRRLFPFYTFSRHKIPWVAKQLIERPGGGMGQTIQAINSAADRDTPVPDYIAETASVPLGELSDGSKRYLTGFGLSFEDPAQFAGILRGDLQQPLRELASRLNPLPKSLIELTTGQSLFQAGPFGGRALEDLDPPIGRTIQNLSDLVTGERTQVADPFLSRGVEFAVANSPLARMVNTIRTVTDPRKLENPLALATNTLTGVKMSDVSPGAQDAITRERAARLMKDLGGLTYRRPYLPEWRQERLGPEELKLFEELQGLLKTLDQRAKIRREAREAEEVAANQRA